METKENATPTGCSLCNKDLQSIAVVFVAPCCGQQYHAACIAIHLRTGPDTTGPKCPNCKTPLWPDDSDDSDYVPSSEESDDHTYEERNGIDTQAMK